MIQNMPKASITIPVGGMYQEWSCLMDLVEEDTAKILEQLANTNGWREVQSDEAKEMGFGELSTTRHLSTSSDEEALTLLPSMMAVTSLLSVK